MSIGSSSGGLIGSARGPLPASRSRRRMQELGMNLDVSVDESLSPGRLSEALGGFDIVEHVQQPPPRK